MDTLLGFLIIVIAGLIGGAFGWPVKLMKKFQFEHWWFIGMLAGLFGVPWLFTLLFCPNAFDAYRSVEVSALIKSNIFSLAWGIANILCGLCFVRIGISLTMGTLLSIGMSVGVTVPMIIKGSGAFGQSADLLSPAGMMVMLGVVVMLIGVTLVAMAGFGRERSQRASEKKSGSFAVGLIMSIVAGVLSVGVAFAFVYSQGPIVDAMKAHGAHDVWASVAVWAVGLVAGGLVNVLYPAYLITRNKSWTVLAQSGKEIFLSLLIGFNIVTAFILMGVGMIKLGALGASVGWGLYQGFQIIGAQAVGFISGEWRGVRGTPIAQMRIAIAILLVAAAIMAYSKLVASSTG